MRPFVLLALLCSSLFAADDPKVAALTAVDDARVAGMLMPSKVALDSVLSDDLRYAHSNGKVDTKASLTASLHGCSGSVAPSLTPFERRTAEAMVNGNGIGTGSHCTVSKSAAICGRSESVTRTIAWLAKPATARNAMALV